MSVLRFNCQECRNVIELKSKDSMAYVCPSCFSGYKIEGGGLSKVLTFSPIPEDMTPLKIGTTGKSDGRNFEIIGRVRYVYDQGYLNEWSIVFQDGKEGYLGEAYGGFSIYGKIDYKIDTNIISHIFKEVDFPQKKKFTVTSISINTNYSCEGELFDTCVFPTGFKSIELCDGNSEMAMINISTKGTSEVFQGKLFDFEEMQFKNLRELNDWI